jgi:hypothetical protein
VEEIENRYKRISSEVVSCKSVLSDDPCFCGYEIVDFVNCGLNMVDFYNIR